MKKYLKTFSLSVLLLSGALINPINTWGSLERAQQIYNTGDKNKYPQLVKELIQNGMHFSAIPFFKEYLTVAPRGRNTDVDNIADELITHVGVRQFESLSASLLEKSNAATMRYVSAKKLFRLGKYEEALKFIDRKLDDDHPIKPFALLLEGSIYAVQKKTDDAIKVFRECIDTTESRVKDTTSSERLRQLKINRDYCIIGIPRVYFAAQSFDKAYSSYLDLPKSSYIWPEILFEEAWTSFYLRDFNRTLGKLVTYKAPVMNYIFNPEIDVLNALTYMEMCLWADSKKVVNTFYEKYEKDFDDYRRFLSSLGKDYRQYYLLIKDLKEEKLKVNPLIAKALISISRDSTYIELFESFNSGRDEIERVKNMHDSSIKSALNNSLRESLTLQRNLIGGYIRGQLKLYENQMVRSFEDMSYIKLEILSRRKSELYEDLASGTLSRNRGDLINLKRTEKQYFWTFNGEFWADELGDYVFSLKSECR